MTTSFDGELRALRAGCGLFDRGPGSPSGFDVLRMSGADRGRFLGGLVTHDVKSLEPGRGSFGFVTNLKGRVLADLTALAFEDTFWLLLPPGRGQAMARHLGKYKIVDRVEIEPIEARSLLLIGPHAARLLASVGVDDPPAEPWSHAWVTIAGKALLLVREPELGLPCFSLWSQVPEALDEAREALRTAASELVEPGLELLDALRVLAGRPRYGVDYGIDFAEDAFPQETGLGEEAVSYTKGCYLGQEVVARIHYRGGVNRQLRGLRLPAGDPASMVGRALLSDGREVGRLTSAARVDECSLGLAILHRRAEPGAMVTLADGDVVTGSEPCVAEVVELPFD